VFWLAKDLFYNKSLVEGKQCLASEKNISVKTKK
jgi:hypothetical protein